MNCGFCRSELPSGAAICPRCGTVTPDYFFDSPPAPSADPYGASPQKPSTLYDSQPYGASPQNPYGTLLSSPSRVPPHVPLPPMPYSIPSSVPPYSPPLPRRRSPNVGVLLGVALLILVLVGAALFVLLQHAGSSPSSPARPTAIGNTAQNPYPPHTGKLVLNDPMHDNSKGYKWDEGTITNAGTCGFMQGAYHIHTFQKGLICLPEASDLVFSNLVFEVKVTILQGDQAAIVVRTDQTKGTGYYFYITIQGNFSLCRDSCNQQTLSSGSNAAINKGQNQSNLLAVVANGTTISVYVNNEFVTSADDNSYSQGQIGVEGFSSSGPADVVASNARVWTL